MNYQKLHKSGDVVILPDAIGGVNLPAFNKHSIYASGSVTVNYRLGDRDWTEHTLLPPADAVNGYADSPIWNQQGVAEIKITCNAATEIRVESSVNGGR